MSDGLRSVVYPSVELARRLAAAGHRVVHASGERFRDVVEHQGLVFRALGSGSGLADFRRTDEVRSYPVRLAVLADRRARAVAALEPARFEALLREEDPDLVLIDGEMHEHIVLARAAGRRVALLNTFSGIWRRPGVPPLHTPIRPGVGCAGSSGGIDLAWRAYLVRKKGAVLRRWIRHAGCDRLSLVRRLAASRGVDLASEVDTGHWLVPFVWRRLPVLVLHALELDFPHDPPAGVRWVGPLLLEDRGGHGELPPGLAEVLERRRSGACRELVYAGFGSTTGIGCAVRERLAAVVEERPGRELIVTRGSDSGSHSRSDSRSDPDPTAGRPGSLDDRVHVFPWVPQPDVLRLADAVITHGGIHTIDESLMRDVPLVVLPGGETDMAGNAARVAHHGVGLVADPRRATGVEVRDHVDRVLVDPAIARNVERLGRTLRSYGERRIAEEAVADLLAGRWGGEEAEPPGSVPGGPR